MNKLFTKIAALSVGLAMAIGVGVAVGGKGVVRAKAADTVLTFNLSSNPGNWPTASSAGNYTYTLSGTDYTFVLGANVYCNSGYLMLKSTTSLGLPAISGKKLTKVIASNTSGCSDQTRVGISSSSSSASYISGGAYQTWSTKGSSYTYNLTGTSNNTMYYLYITNKNCQIISLELTYSDGSTPSGTVSVGLSTNSLDIDLYSSATASLTATATATGSATTGLSAESSDATVAELSTGSPTSGTAFTVTGKKVGTATITVKSTWDENVSKTCTVNVTDSTPTPTPTSSWVATSIADLTSDDVFVIVGDNDDTYAMSNNNGTSGAPTAVAVTVSGNYLTSDVSDTIKWSISGNSTDGYSFYPNGETETWLYCTNTNNGIRVGTNANKTFTVEGGYLKHNGTSRYVGIYNSQDWRCYASTSTNINDQTFAYYKYVDNSPRITAVAGKTSLGVDEDTTVTVTKLNGAEGTFSFEKDNDKISVGLPSIEGDVATYTITGKTDGNCAIRFTLINTEQEINTVEIAFTVHKALSSITLSGNYPTQLEKGSPFSHEGMVVTATYDDASTGDVTSSATFSGYNMDSTGQQTVTVSYTESNVTKTTTYTLTVVQPTKFTVTFDSNGGSAVASITNIETGTAISKPADPTKTNYDFVGWYTDSQLQNEYDFASLVTSNFTLYAKWALHTDHAGTSADPYSVADARLAIDANDGVTSVYATGIVSSIVTAYSSQHGNITFDMVDNLSDSDFLRAYRCSVSATDATKIKAGVIITVSGDLVKYNNEIYEFSQGCVFVSVVEKELTKIELSGDYQTSFVEGESFNHDGLVVTATYDDTSTEDVTSDATFSTPNMNQIGAQTITVSYSDKETTYQITITEREVSSIDVASSPTKTTYYVGDTMDISGLTITVTYKTGDPATIDSGFTVSPSDYEFTDADLLAGSKQFTVAYKSKSAYFTVDVVTTPTTVEDVLTYLNTRTETTYADWSGVTDVSDAVYAGNSMNGTGDNKESIQMRSNNNNSGIVSTTSGGKIKSVTLVWHSTTASERTINVYGKNSAYTAATDLYDSDKQGKLLGTIVCGTSTELSISGDYEYVGIRSASGGLNLDSVTFSWDPGTTPTPAGTSIVSGTFDYNDKTSLYVDDNGTIVVSAPEGFEYLYYAGDEGYLIICDDYEYNSTTKQASFTFITDSTATADVQLDLYWSKSSSDYSQTTEVHETIQLVNPTGLAAAREFAKDINDCCGTGASMSELWELVAGEWDDLSEAAKSFLLDAHYDVAGTGDDTVVTKHADTHNELAAAMSRYDYMVEVYGMTNFMNKAGLSSGRISNNPFALLDKNTNSTAVIVIVSVISAAAIGGYFFLRKRRKED